MTLFLAHVPALVLTGRTYSECNAIIGCNGWMPEGVLGLFGTNALDTHPHPDGDGVLLIGSCV